ncbi:uncharacterized protein YukE [Nocardia kruczakiae]|uniref:Uncharacterized protein YukE n=1 Tax=Nocardia kruczakiae TaxID=261477 RepID=A0ABU1XQN7_9NOCA|nr:hypothetical protein [Nocardia kruczakiae]MDR7172881.1 uncharacterized protein YukE [Nocardia kruczakiae]
MTEPSKQEQAYQAGLSKAHNDLERFLREDGTNVFDKEAWNGNKPKLTDQDVNALLDKAAPGLQWFERALVRYHRVWDVLKLPGFEKIDVSSLSVDGTHAVGAEHIDTTKDPLAEIRRLEYKYYDQQRSMNLASLRDLGAKITAAAQGSDSHPGATDISTDLAGIANAVPEVWEGQAGDAAHDHLAGFHAHADQQAQYLEAVSSALNGLPDVLLQIVRDKADFIAGFDSPQCPVAGHAMRLGDEDPVSTIITAAAGKGSRGSLQDDREVVARQFHLGLDSGDSEYDKMVTQTCKDWLSNHFAIAVREAFTAFVHQCALADFYIRRAYQPVTDLLDGHDARPFPKPSEQPVPTGPPTTSAGPTSTASTHATSIDPTSMPVATSGPQQTTTPVAPASSQANPFQALSGLASQAGQTIQQGLSQLQSTAGQAISSLATNAAATTASDVGGEGAPPGSKTLVNANLPGGSLTVTQAPNGTVTATITGADGKPHRYSMGIKDGKPFLTADSDTETAPSKDGAKDLSAATTQGSRSPTSGGGHGTSIPPTSSVERPAAGGSFAAIPKVPSDNTRPASTNAAQAADSASGGAMPAMGGMPMGAGGAMGGGKAGGDSERKSKGLVQPRKLWDQLPGPDGSALVPSEFDQWPDEERANFATGPQTHSLPAQSEPTHAPEPAPGPTPAAASAAPAPLAPSADDAVPVRRNDGVKIEIDMGEAK